MPHRPRKLYESFIETTTVVANRVNDPLLTLDGDYLGSNAIAYGAPPRTYLPCSFRRFKPSGSPYIVPVDSTAFISVTRPMAPLPPKHSCGSNVGDSGRLRGSFLFPDHFSSFERKLLSLRE